MAWRQIIIWTNADLIHWCTYAALGGDDPLFRLLPSVSIIDQTQNVIGYSMHDWKGWCDRTITKYMYVHGIRCHHPWWVNHWHWYHNRTTFTNPRMHLFHIPECSIQNRNMHISVLNGAFWDMEQVHKSGICELGQWRKKFIHPNNC